MSNLLRRPRCPRLILAAALVVALLAVAALLVLATSHRTHPVSAPSTASTLSPAPPSSAPASTMPSPPVRSAPAVIGSGQDRITALPRTSSADLYAAAVAVALWDIDYGTTSRTQLLAFWRQQLATEVPAGLPAGTTVTQTQDAAMSTLQSYLPTAAMWTNLSSDHTTSNFTVTAVSEPSSWVAAIASGQITDPGLTARTVLGVQTITYGDRANQRTTSQSQQLTVALLCPPTTGACSVEIIPPVDTAGTGG